MKNNETLKKLRVFPYGRHLLVLDVLIKDQRKNMQVRDFIAKIIYKNR